MLLISFDVVGILEQSRSSLYTGIHGDAINLTSGINYGFQRPTYMIRVTLLEPLRGTSNLQ